jgi:hypothetical protein
MFSFISYCKSILGQSPSKWYQSGKLGASKENIISIVRGETIVSSTSCKEMLYKEGTSIAQQWTHAREP